MSSLADRRPTMKYLSTALATLRGMPCASALVFDPDLRFVLVAGDAVIEAGFDPAAMEGRLAADVLPATRWPIWEPLYRAALLGEQSSREVQAIGEPRWYSVEVAPWRGEDGTIVGGIAMAHDITAQKLAQDRIEGLLESAPDAMVVVDEQGVIVRVNAQTEKLFRYQRSELLKQRVEMLLPQSARAGHVQLRSVYAADPHTREMGSGLELQARRSDGTEFPVEVSLSPLKTDAGTFISSAIRDISERKRLEAHAEHLAALVESSADAIISKTTDGIIVSWNPGAARLYGYTEAEALGKPISMLTPEGQEDEVKELIARAVRGERIDHFETPRRCKDGSIKDISLTISAVRDASGHVIGASTIARDITARKQMEEQLRLSREQALEASHLKSEFVANMSHEIRTPLNGVVCMAELLLDTDLDSDQRDYAEVALTSAEALMRVINDILDFSKIEAGKLDIVIDNYSIETAVSDVSHIVAPKAHEKQVELVVSIDADVPPTLRGDGNRVRQVLTNLLGNAVKFTIEGEIVVRVGVERVSSGQEMLRVEVADTGIGIEPEVLPKLFQAFSQGDATTTRNYGGSGLGLCIAKQLVEIMGGEVGVDSTPGEGSTFWFSLPCERGTVVDANLPVRDLAGVRLLIVDDNATNRAMLEQQVRDWEMSSDSADGGHSALKLMRQAADTGRPYELAVIDMHMPGMDGLELARTARADPRLRSTRLIMLSSSPVTWSEAGAAGFEAELAKPVGRSRLYNQFVSSLERTTRTGTQHPRRESGTTTPPLSRDVLVAEDDQVNQFAAEQVLRKLGFNVEIAANGRQAIEMTGQKDYAAVFMDCQMPEIDGYTATTEIRRREADARHTPIIAMTAHTMDGARARCLAAGMDDYISKPLRLNDVAQACERIAELERDADMGEGDPTPNSRASPATRPEDVATTAETTSQGSRTAEPPLEPAGVERLRSQFGSTGTLQRLVELFASQTPKDIAGLRTAIAAADALSVRDSAHTLKGRCLTLAATQMAELCSKLETLASGDSLDGADALVEQIERAFSATHDALLVEVS